MTEARLLDRWLGPSGALLALARPVSPTLSGLAALHLIEILVLPVLVCFGHQALGISVPVALGLVARALRGALQRSARRRLRGAFMVRAARESLDLGSPAEAGADAAFWGAHILEYALCVDAPAIVGAGTGAMVIVLLAAHRLGSAPVAGVSAVLALAMLASLLMTRARRADVDAIVQRRHDMAVWMAAAMQDEGEISSAPAREAFSGGVASRARRWSDAEDGLERRRAIHRALIGLCALVPTLFLARAFGWWQRLPGPITLDGLGSLLLIGTLLPAAYSLSVHLESLAVARTELRRLWPDPVASRVRGQARLSAKPRVLSASHLATNYGAQPALVLDALTLDLTRPLVITGPNGAGKTTLAKLCAGLRTPDRGSLLVDGVAPTDLSADTIAFVPQHPVLLESLSVLENMRLVAPHCSAAEAEAILKRLGMPRSDRALHEPAGSFSRGEGRRIATARALLTPARLLVLDEPDAWLDASGRSRLVRVLLEHAEQASIVLVSHRPDVVAHFDQIVALSASHEVEAVGDRAAVEAGSAAFRDLKLNQVPTPEQ